MPPRRGAALLPIVGGASLSIALVAQAPPATGQVFRSRTTVVPVDVRVLDRRGRPITDLTAADFTLRENGVPQTIEYFAAHALTPAAPEPAVSIRLATGSTGTLRPQNRRLFLILLGRGRLQEPSKGIDATLRFVRQRLLPQDQVAVMAWNRATDFTTDHEKAAEVLERFRTHHEAIEALLRQYFGGLTALYAGPRIPSSIQTLIDRVFGGPQGGSSREVLPGRSLAREEADARRAIELRQRSELEAFRLFGNADTPLADAMADPTLDIGFEEYVALSRQTMQDVGNLYAGIEFLRYIDGEKHLIFVTEQGFSLPRAEHDRDLGTMAADARVAINTLQTGGVATTIGPDGMPVVRGAMRLAALRTISEVSGGQTSISRMADAAYDRLLSATGFVYLLGYSSNGPDPNGRPRRIQVETRRRGAEVFHRQAYVARAEPARFDPRQSLATTRLAAAAGHAAEIRDLRLTAKLADVRQGGLRAVDAEITIDASRLIFARAGEEFLAALNIAIVCGDFENRNIGEVWESRDVRIPASRLDEIRQTGLVVPVRVEVKQPPAYVKIMVYDYGSDLLGSIVRRMR